MGGRGVSFQKTKAVREQTRSFTAIAVRAARSRILYCTHNGAVTAVAFDGAIALATTTSTSAAVATSCGGSKSSSRTKAEGGCSGRAVSPATASWWMVTSRRRSYDSGIVPAWPFVGRAEARCRRRVGVMTATWQRRDSGVAAV